MTAVLPASIPLARWSAGSAWLLATLVLLTAAIWPALTVVATFWSQDEYSHAWLIGPLTVLLVLHRLPSVTPGPRTWAGVWIAGVALLVLAAGWLTRNSTLSIYGAVAGIFALVWASLGRRAMQRLAGPILFLLFMIPLPLVAYISLSQSMQLLSSRIGVELLRLFGVIVVREGNIIELVNGRLEVAAACNGLRYLFPLLSISCLLALLLEDRPWKKAVLFVSAVPIAIGLNGLRVALIGVLVDRFGIGMAEGAQHEIEGFLVFAVCVGLLLFELYLLLGADRRRRFATTLMPFPQRRSLTFVLNWPEPPAFHVTAGILAGGAALMLLVSPRGELVPERRSLAVFPMQIATWQGVPKALDPDTLRALGLTDYVLADFADPAHDDRAVNVFAAYYASQRPGVQVHSPRQCIPGGGWDILGQSRIVLTTAEGPRVPANRVVIARNGTRQIVYYWFEERGRHLVSEAEIKVFALVDMVTRNRSDGALVRLVAPVVDGDDEGADRALQQIVRNLAPMLPAYLPG